MNIIHEFFGLGRPRARAAAGEFAGLLEKFDLALLRVYELCEREVTEEDYDQIALIISEHILDVSQFEVLRRAYAAHYNKEPRVAYIEYLLMHFHELRPENVPAWAREYLRWVLSHDRHQNHSRTLAA